MADYLTVQDAADMLGVEYKTIYRAVVSGQLPAFRIGRVYRIRRQDFDAYLNARMTSPITAASDPDEPIICGSCGAAIPAVELSGGPCSDGKCDELICATCWDKDLRTCRTHRPSPTSRLEAARLALAKGQVDRLVTALEARQREQAFIARFEDRMYGIAALQNPLNSELIQVDDWRSFHSSSDESSRLLEVLGVAFLERSVLAVTPVNAASRFAIPAGGLGRSRPSQGVIVEAVSRSDLDTQVRQGWVTQPAAVAELMDLLHSRQAEAEQANALFVLALAATSGWDAASAAYVGASAEGRSYRHRLLLPLLVDLHTTSLHYNTADERLRGVAGLFRLTDEGEEMMRVRQWAQAAFDVEFRSGVAVDEAAEALGVSAALVLRSFRQMAQNPKYRFSDDSGGMLMVVR